MRCKIWCSLAVVTLLASGAALPAAAAEAGATLVGSFADWFVYRAGEGENRVCYALSQPRESTPAEAGRGQVFFLVSSWPGTDKANEPSVVPGYPYGEDANVRVEVGGARFDFAIVRNVGDEGGAWMEDPAEERRLIDSMRAGANMTVTGTSTRGTLTRDTFSLAGITAALDNLGSICN